MSWPAHAAAGLSGDRFGEMIDMAPHLYAGPCRLMAKVISFRLALLRLCTLVHQCLMKRFEGGFAASGPWR